MLDVRRAILAALVLAAVARTSAGQAAPEDGSDPDGKDPLGNYYEEFTSEELQKWKIVTPELSATTLGSSTPSQGDADRAKALLDRAAREKAESGEPDFEAEEGLLEDPGSLTIEARIVNGNRQAKIPFRGDARFPQGTILSITVRCGSEWLDLRETATVHDLVYDGVIEVPGLLATGEYRITAQFLVDEQSDLAAREKFFEIGIKPRILARTTVGLRDGLSGLTERLGVQMTFREALDRLSDALVEYERVHAGALSPDSYRKGIVFDAEWFGADVTKPRAEIDRVRRSLLQERDLYFRPPLARAWDEFFEVANSAVEVTDVGAREIVAELAGAGAPTPPLPDWYVPTDASGRRAEFLLVEARERIDHLRRRLAIQSPEALDRACLLWAIAVVDTTIEETEAARKEFLALPSPGDADWKVRAEAAIEACRTRKTLFRELVARARRIHGDLPPSPQARAFLSASATIDLLPRLVAAQTAEALRQARLPPPPVDGPTLAEALVELERASALLRDAARETSPGQGGQ